MEGDGFDIDLGDVQGIIARGYKDHWISRHLLFHFGTVAGGRRFLSQLAPLVTSSSDWGDDRPSRLLNLGLTADGLRALGTREAILADFPSDFRDGPDARSLGDAGGSAPDRWWEEQFQTSHLHGITHLYADSDRSIQEITDRVREFAEAAGVEELVPRADGTPLEGRGLGPDHDRVHFGYRDGISQPDVEWKGGEVPPEKVSFRHFLLGYSTPEVLSSPPDGPAADLARDGSYAVFRWMYQDVAAFNAFLKAQAPRLAPLGGVDPRTPEDREELLAAKLIGRWRHGAPLVLAPDAPARGLADRNDFLFERDDPKGERCPFSAHIRVANPRDQPLTTSNFVPRLIRRGVPYGPELASEADDGIDRGLLGIFICASITRQFYKIMEWMGRNDFSKVFEPDFRLQDPLGNREVYDAVPDFLIPAADAPPLRLRGLPNFLRTKGTAMLFVPSLTGVRRLAAGDFA